MKLHGMVFSSLFYQFQVHLYVFSILTISSQIPTVKIPFLLRKKTFRKTNFLHENLISNSSFNRRTRVLAIIIKKLDFPVHAACHQLAIVSEPREFVVSATGVDFWVMWRAVTVQ